MRNAEEFIKGLPPGIVDRLRLIFESVDHGDAMKEQIDKVREATAGVSNANALMLAAVLLDIASFRLDDEWVEAAGHAVVLMAENMRRSRLERAGVVGHA